jgi:tRNA U34 2-thiouridine synthase MnmA/TrmU
MHQVPHHKALALVSGGLDSMLAVKVVQEQGILVEGINFYTGFCIEGHTQAIRSADQHKPKRNNALWVAEQLGIKLHFMDVVEEYKDVLLNPKHGYGANVNPCLDCKIFMVRKALEYADKHGFDFIITGEVVGQRPNSQLKHKMHILSKEADHAGRLLRPLSAKLLPPTVAEKEGWIEREKLLDWSGRSRKPQMALAKQYGFTDYATPAGGCCFLTDESYAKKLRDLWDARGEREYELDDIVLLKIGRHIRPAPHFKLIVARDEGESNYLSGYRHEFITLQAHNEQGPVVLLDGQTDDADIQLAARITLRFGKGRDLPEVPVTVRQPDGVEQVLTVAPMPAAEILPAWYV